MIRSHLIVKDIQDEYSIRWIGRILDTKPRIKNGKPIFIVISGGGRIELNTTDMTRIEKCAKSLTRPRGRQAVTTDTARILIKEEDGNEKLMGILTHNRIKTFAPMYDAVGYREDYS